MQAVTRLRILGRQVQKKSTLGSWFVLLAAVVGLGGLLAYYQSGLLPNTGQSETASVERETTSASSVTVTNPISNATPDQLRQLDVEALEREEAIEQARLDAEELSRKAEEERAQLAAAEEARKAEEEEAQLAAAEETRKAAEEQARLAEEARRAAEEQAQLAAAEEAREAAEEQERLAAAEEARKAEEEQAQLAAAEEARRAAAEEQARLAAAEEARKIAQEQAQLAAVEEAREAAEEQERLAAAEEARKAEEEQAQLAAAEEARRATEEQARLAAAEEARRAEEEQAQLAAAEEAREAAEEQARLAAAEEARKAEEEQAQLAVAEEARKAAEEQANLPDAGILLAFDLGLVQLSGTLPATRSVRRAVLQLGNTPGIVSLLDQIDYVRKTKSDPAWLAVMETVARTINHATSSVSVAIEGRRMTVSGTVASEEEQAALSQSLRGVFGNGLTVIDVAAVSEADLQSTAIPSPVPASQLSSLEALRIREMGELSLQAGGIGFLPGRWDISSRSQPALDMIFEILFLYSDISVLIEVNVNDSGSERQNLLVSRQRARSIGRYLVGRGINVTRIDVVGRGNQLIGAQGRPGVELQVIDTTGEEN